MRIHRLMTSKKKGADLWKINRLSLSRGLAISSLPHPLPPDAAQIQGLHGAPPPHRGRRVPPGRALTGHTRVILQSSRPRRATRTRCDARWWRTSSPTRRTRPSAPPSASPIDLSYYKVTRADPLSPVLVALDLLYMSTWFRDCVDH